MSKRLLTIIVALVLVVTVGLAGCSQQTVSPVDDNNIYTIARIFSFKDPKYAARYPEKAITYKSNGQPFTNSDGIIWLSAHDRQLWEYNIEVAKEAAKVGFDEIQFDYVRFPASNGGKLDMYLDYKNELNESKPVTIQNYLKYAREELSSFNVYISADIYGQGNSCNYQTMDTRLYCNLGKGTYKIWSRRS